jgi:hypothetical protein
LGTRESSLSVLSFSCTSGELERERERSWVGFVLWEGLFWRGGGVGWEFCGEWGWGGGGGNNEEEEEEQEEEVREQDEVVIVVVGGALRFEARKNKEGRVFAGWIDPR